MKLVDVSVKRPVGVMMFVIAAIVLGVISLKNLAVDLLPEMDIPVAVIVTSYDGASPQEVEQLISRPIESAVGGIEGIKTVDSTSSPGSSLVILQFDWGRNIDESMNAIRERIDQVGSILPDDASKPSILRIDPQQTPVMWLSLSGAPLDQLQDITEEVVQPGFERVDGVASVTIQGGQTREIQVLLDKGKLATYGITGAQVVQALGAENRAASAGNLTKGNQDLQLRIDGQFSSIKEIEETLITLHDGKTIRVSDVATVVDSFKNMAVKAKVNNVDSLILSIMKQSDGNTVQVANSMNQAIKEMQSKLDDNIKLEVVFDTSKFIKDSINSVVSNMLVGGLLAIFVLLLFLRSFRTTLVIAISMPISIISTFTLMYFTGETLNILSMGGLALGLGMMVDSSIVILENIFIKRQEGLSIIEAARIGAAEIGPAVVSSAITTVVVFFPIVFVDGIASMIFRPLAYTVAFSNLAALVVSLTLVPMLSSKMLNKVNVDFNGENQRGFEHYYHKLKNIYGIVLNKALKFRKTTVIVTFVAIVGSCALIPFIGFEFIPDADQGQINISATTQQGSKLAETEELVQEINKLLEPYSDIIETNFVTIGSGSQFGDTKSNKADFLIQLVSSSAREITTSEFIRELEAKTKNIPGAEFKISTGDIGIGGGAPISVNISGPDLDVLGDLAQQIVWLLEEIEGTSLVESSVAEGRPELSVIVNRQLASEYGLSYQQIMNELTLGFSGQVATRYKESGNEFDVRILLPEESRQTIRDLETMVIRSSRGVDVPITAVAELRQIQGPAQIDRSNQQRKVSVTSEVVDRDLGTVMQEVEQRLAKVHPPEGYQITIGGQAEEMTDSFTKLTLALLLSIFLVYMVMAVQFESFIHPFIIMFSLPTTVIGIIVGLFITGNSLSVTAFIGIIMLAGIVVNNAIVLISYINILRDEGVDRHEAIIESGLSRLRPILMTTLTTVLGMIPLALGIGEGAEMQAPLAVVTIFGLSFSTVFTLVFVPVMYVLLDDINNKTKHFFKKGFFKRKNNLGV